MDGVLIDSEPFHKEVEEKLYAGLGVSLTHEEQQRFVGMKPKDIWTYVCRNMEGDVDVNELVENEKRAKCDEIVKRTIVCIDGVDVLIKDLKEAGFNLSVASSSPHELIEIITARLGIRTYFDFVVSGEDVENGKPHPDIFLKVAELYGCEPVSCLVVEDSKNGAKAAKAAGMKCLGFQNLNSGNQDLSIADKVVDSFKGLQVEDIEELLA